MKMKKLVALSVVFMLAHWSCSAPEQIHYSLICQSSLDQCGPKERIDFFNEFARSAIHNAGSTYNIYYIDRGDYYLLMKLCVPSGSLGIKEKWLTQARSNLKADQFPYLQDCGQTANGKNKIKLVGQDLLSTDMLDIAPANTGQPFHTLLLCDISDSTLEFGCTRGVVKDIVSHWIGESGFAPGSTFEIYLVGQSRDTARRVYQAKISTLPLGERVADSLSQLQRIPNFSTPSINSSAIIEALNVVNRSLQDKNGATELIIVSDMRQVTPQQWNFESQVPDKETFLDWARQRGLIQPLSASSVRVCGLHQFKGPGAQEFTALMDSRLEELWKAVFTKMNANPRFTQDCEF